MNRTPLARGPLKATPRRRRRPRRWGAMLVWFAAMFTALLGMVGLVIDVGLLMATHRQTQNAADAAALAGALDLLYTGGNAQATATATQFVTQYNGLTGAPDPVVRIPPVSGPYTGAPGYVEVLAAAPMQTYFIHLLPGIAQNQIVQARAVAGSEAIAAGEGVCVLDPDAWPGLDVTGGGVLKVFGTVIIDSEGGGVDENGNPVDNGNLRYAGKCSNNSVLMADYIHCVGGVNKPFNFENIDPLGPSPLHCNLLRIPDPLLYLPVPTTALGVVDIDRGAPQVTNTNIMFNDPSFENYPEPHVTPEGEDVERAVLLPGIYTSIDITGGYVRFVPGIYVIRPNPNTENVVKITGGDVEAMGIMIYATGHNYSPDTGNPDNNDADKAPPHADGAEFGGITINASMKLGPIDFDEHDYSAFPVDPVFEGMLFFQRRRNGQAINIEGNAAEGRLSGTLYAKWAPIKIAGQGTYDAQFVVGSMVVTGTGDIVIHYTGKKLGKAPQIFLVE